MEPLYRARVVRANEYFGEIAQIGEERKNSP